MNIRQDLFKRRHHEFAFQHPRMWNLKAWSDQCEVTVKKYVYVYRPGMVDAIPRPVKSDTFIVTTKFPFDGFQFRKQRLWRNGSGKASAAVHEIRTDEACRLAFDEIRDGLDPHRRKGGCHVDSPADIFLPIPHVRAIAQIYRISCLLFFHHAKITNNLLNGLRIIIFVATNKGVLLRGLRLYPTNRNRQCWNGNCLNLPFSQIKR